MSSSFAKTTIIGRLGADAELKTLPSGTDVLNFNVATDKWVPAGQEKKTVWYRVSVWGKLAETMIGLIENYGALSKGDSVFIEGELDINAYMTNDGQPRASLELNARELRLLGGKNGGQ